MTAKQLQERIATFPKVQRLTTPTGFVRQRDIDKHGSIAAAREARGK